MAANTTTLNTVATNLSIPLVAASIYQSGQQHFERRDDIKINVPNTTTATACSLYFVCNQRFTMTAKGLKPSSQHFFTFSGVSQANNVQPFGGTLGANLVTDSTGSLTFYFYYNSGIASTSDQSASQSMLNNLAGTKQGIIASSDNTSIAVASIQFLASGSLTNTFPLAIVSSIPNGGFGYSVADNNMVTGDPNWTMNNNY